jgi:hypothetical protein
VDVDGIPDPEWLAGFSDGEGCFFFVNISKAPLSKWGYQIQLRFSISQHIRDIELMESLILLLGCGKVMLKTNGSAI